MAIDKSPPIFSKGKVYWAKIIGAPRTNYDGDGREWAFEFEPEDTSFLKTHGLLDRLKNKHEDRGPYIILRKKELNAAGEKNEPIRVYDEDNNAWDDRLIGNGSSADAKLVVVDYGKGKKKGLYIQALRITNLIPYVTSEFGGMDGGEAKPAKKPSNKVSFDELEDDIPF